MKRAILFLVLLITIAGELYSQTDDSTKYVWYKFQYGSRMPRYWADSVFHIPYLDTAQLLKSDGTKARAGALQIRPQDSSLYVWNGDKWNNASATQLTDSSFVIAGDTIVIHGTGGSAIDTTSLSDRISLKADQQALEDTAAAIRADFPAGGGSPGGSNTQVQYNNAGAFAGDAGLTYNATQNKLTTDSLAVIRARMDRLHLNPLTVGPVFTEDSLVFIGNSITYGSNANPRTDSGYAYRVANYFGLSPVNLAIAGTGSITAIGRYNSYINPGHNATGLINVGFNDLRRNAFYGASGYKTYNKIINTYKAFWANHLLKSWVNPSAGSGVTRYGSWSTNWNASSGGGKSVSLGAYTNTTNDSITYAFSDSTLVLGFIGGDGSSASYIGATIEVYIDNVLIETVDLNNQTDGVTDGGTFDYQRQPVVRIYTGLTNSSHTVKIIKTAATGYLLMDYFGHLKDRTGATKQIMYHIPLMSTAGYALSPNASSAAITAAMNLAIDSLYNALPQDYGAYLVPTENFYNLTTGLDADEVHPNNTGHGQIFQGTATSLLLSLPGNQVVTDGSYLYLFVDDLPVKIAMDAELRAYINNLISNSGTGIVGKTTVTSNTLTKWTGASPATIGNSNITDNGSTITATGTINLNGAVNFQGTGIAGFNIYGRGDNTLKWSVYSPGTAGDFRMFNHVGSTIDRFTFTQLGRLGIGTTSPLVTLHVGGTDAVAMNGGTSAQRPSGAAGYIRWNSDSTAFELYDGSNWRCIATRKWVTDHGYATTSNINTMMKDSAGYYTISGTTTDATPTNISVIPVSIGYAISIEATCIAITADGDDAFSGIKHRAYHKTSGGVLTSLTQTTIAPDAYVGGGLSTATFTLTNSGTDAAIQVTGEAATTINWKIRYKLVSINVAF